jgi:hypothetical protein
LTNIFPITFYSLEIVLEQQEADLLKAQKEARRALREKKALQKANEQANLGSDNEGEYEPRPTPTVCSLSFFFFPFLLTLS